jgi:hypothetical protein
LLNKTIQHENNYRYLIIFQHEFAFAQNSKLTGTIAAKNNGKKFCKLLLF